VRGIGPREGRAPAARFRLKELARSLLSAECPNRSTSMPKGTPDNASCSAIRIVPPSESLAQPRFRSLIDAVGPLLNATVVQVRRPYLKDGSIKQALRDPLRTEVQTNG
jgi:hypothetical protein